MLVFLIILLLLILSGAIWFVLKVAVGVAIGLILASIVVGAIVARRIRRALGWDRRDDGRWRRVPRSRVEVLQPPPDERSA